MPQTRKLVRDAIRTALSDEDQGFNVTLAAIADDYGIEPFTFDWTAGSENFIESQLDGVGVSASRLTDKKISLYTTEARSKELAAGRSKGAAFEGFIRAHVDVYLEFRDGEDVTDDLTETYADAVEDVMITILVDPHGPFQEALFSGPVYNFGDFACVRLPIEQLDNGYAQLLPFQFIYEVHV